jgi:hypothetical protein
MLWAIVTTTIELWAQKDPLFCNEHRVQVHPKRKRKNVASIRILGLNSFLHPHFLSRQPSSSKREKKKKSSKLVIVTIVWVEREMILCYIRLGWVILLLELIGYVFVHDFLNLNCRYWIRLHWWKLKNGNNNNSLDCSIVIALVCRNLGTCLSRLDTQQFKKNCVTTSKPTIDESCYCFMLFFSFTN